MRRFSTFCVTFGVLCTLFGCQSTPTAIPDQRPGDFRLGVVVMAPDREQTNGLNDARYIVDSSSVLRASFGAGSTLETYPGFTRRLTSSQMNAIWMMSRDLLESNNHRDQLFAGQPQGMVQQTSGTIIEIHLNARDEVFAFDARDQQAAAIVDALSDLAWIDRVPNRVAGSDTP